MLVCKDEFTWQVVAHKSEKNEMYQKLMKMRHSLARRIMARDYIDAPPEDQRPIASGWTFSFETPTAAR